MTTELAKPQSKQLSPQEQKLQTISTYIMARKDALMQVIANGLSPERLVKIICAAASRTPRLLECTPASIYSCLHTSAQLGLELGGPLKHAHPVPFKNNKSGQMECTLIIGYEGYLELVRRTGQIATIYAEAVRQGDVFNHELGLHRDIKHQRKASFDPSGKNVVAAYAVAHLKEGGFQLCVMMRDEIDAIKARSKAADYGPWVTDYEEMAKKTAIRRLQKYLPKSVDVAEALSRDDGDDEAPISVSVDPDTSGLELPAAAPVTDPLKQRLKNATPLGQALPQTTPQTIAPQDPPPAQTVTPPAEGKKGGRKKAAEAAPAATPADPADRQDSEVPSQTTPAKTATPAKPEAPEELSLFVGKIANIMPQGNGWHKYVMDDNSVFYGRGDEFAKGMHAHREAGTKMEIAYVADAKDGKEYIREAAPAKEQ